MLMMYIWELEQKNRVLKTKQNQINRKEKKKTNKTTTTTTNEGFPQLSRPHPLHHPHCPTGAIQEPISPAITISNGAFENLLCYPKLQEPILPPRNNQQPPPFTISIPTKLKPKPSDNAWNRLTRSSFKPPQLHLNHSLFTSLRCFLLERERQQTASKPATNQEKPKLKSHSTKQDPLSCKHLCRGGARGPRWSTGHGRSKIFL